MNSSRQLLLGIGVFLGGGILLYAMMQQIDAPESGLASDNMIETTAELSNLESKNSDNYIEQPPLTADIKTETQILAQKRREREQKMEELDEQTRKFLAEQEDAEVLAMEKARVENKKYHDNTIEPVMDEAFVDTAGEEIERSNIVTKPVVVPRTINNQDTIVETANTESKEPKVSDTKLSQAIDKREEKASQNAETNNTATAIKSAPSSAQDYTVQRGDGLIKLSRRYNIPLAALLQANKLSKNATLVVGQKLIIPSSKQVNDLVRRYQSNQPNQSNHTSQSSPSNQTNQQTPKKSADSATSKTDNDKATNNQAANTNAPKRQLDYQVASGDGLIKLARQYNVPVEALAEANDLSTNSSLRVGQTLTIPSRKQVERLQREAAQKKKNEEAKREAQKRLAQARRKAQSGETKGGTFGVQVALANDQQKADEIVQKMKSAGYPASTSVTSRGVRVIVGPEKGKEAALALKDKIDADTRVNVDGAWVLYWR